MAKREMFPSPSDFLKEREKKSGFRPLPHTEESREEQERLNQEDDLKRFLKVEDIDTWFNDIGQELELEDIGTEEEEAEKDKFEDLIRDFKNLFIPVQQELLQDMQAKMKRNFFRTKKDMIEHFRYLVDKNLEVMKKQSRKRQRK